MDNTIYVSGSLKKNYRQDKPTQEPTKEKAPTKDLEIQKFVRVKRVTLPSDRLPAYQVEIIKVKGDQVISREMTGKRNTAELAFARAADEIDPEPFRF